MAGSSLRINPPGVKDNQKHNNLVNRELPFQHPLESIFRQSDQKDLKTIIEELTSTDKSILCELININTTGERLVTLTTFSYNMAMDVLLVFHNNHFVYEGTDEDYVKTSGTSITFNYDLNANDKIYIILAGTISGQSFGDYVYNGLSKFTQLVDTPNGYYGHGGRVVKVNEQETGLVFGESTATANLIQIVQNYLIEAEGYVEGWLNFVSSGIIKGIKVVAEEGYEGTIRLKIWDSPNGEWIYYSGDVNNILWDIMDIPFIDNSEQDSIYIRLENDGLIATNFLLRIFIIQ